jgi:hypothetical protein
MTELGNLIASANKMCRQKSRKTPAMLVLKRKKPPCGGHITACKVWGFLVGATGFEPATT